MADGDVILDNVTVAGRLVVRGGGENSIRLINKTNVGSISIGKTGSGGIRVMAEEGGLFLFNNKEFEPFSHH